LLNYCKIKPIPDCLRPKFYKFYADDIKQKFPNDFYETLKTRKLINEKTFWNMVDKDIIRASSPIFFDNVHLFNNLINRTMACMKQR